MHTIDPDGKEFSCGSPSHIQQKAQTVFQLSEPFLIVSVTGRCVPGDLKMSMTKRVLCLPYTPFYTIMTIDPAKSQPEGRSAGKENHERNSVNGSKDHKNHNQEISHSFRPPRPYAPRPCSMPRPSLGGGCILMRKARFKGPSGPRIPNPCGRLTRRL